MTSRRLHTGLLALLAATFALGCGSGESDDGASDASSAKPRVALIMKSLANEFFKTMEDGAVSYHAERADEFDLLANGIKNEEDIGGQVTLVEQMIAQQVDAIVIAPADSQALVLVLKRAEDAGIIVVNIDNKLDDETLAEAGLTAPFVGPDNRAGARLAGDFLATKLAAGSPVAVLEGIPSAFNGIERRLGFEDAMSAAGMTIVTSQSANWEMAKANQIASAIITEHPELKAILCANDSMALGAAAALKEAGRSGEVIVIGYDAISAVREMIAAGRVLCSIDQHAADLAVFGIEFALDILGGGAAPENRETPVDLVTAESPAAAAPRP